MSKHPQLPKKLGDPGTNIFTAMNQVSAKHEAINLAQGFPNFGCSDHLKELVTKYMHSGCNQYPPMPGILELREAISDKIEFLYGTKFNSDTEITVTPGGHSALMSAATATLTPGDEVIIFEPAFDCFEPIVRLNGAVPIHVQLKPPSYGIDWAEVKSKVTAKTKMIWINTPHNPTGTVLSDADIESLKELVRDTEIVILSDEVYEHIIFDELPHHSVLRHEELAVRSFAVFSFGKVYHTTGWKVGYCVAPAPLMKEFRNVHQMTTFCTNHPMQRAIAEFLQDRSQYTELPSFYQQKRDFFLDKIKDSKFTIKPASGTYFQSLTYEDISDKGDYEMCEWLAENAKVGAIPMSAFYHDKKEYGVLRFCFAKTEETLEEAAELLCRI